MLGRKIWLAALGVVAVGIAAGAALMILELRRPTAVGGDGEVEVGPRPRPAPSTDAALAARPASQAARPSRVPASTAGAAAPAPAEDRPRDERVTRAGDKEVHWLLGSTADPDVKGIFVTALGGNSPSGDYERDVEGRLTELIAGMKPREPGKYATELFDADKVRSLRQVLKGAVTLTVEGQLVVWPPLVPATAPSQAPAP